MKDIRRTSVEVYDYNETAFSTWLMDAASREMPSLPSRIPSAVRWVNIDGLSDLSLIENICTSFGLHPLVIEDILHTEQRPKIEDYIDYSFIVARSLFYGQKEDGEDRVIIAEQQSIIMGKDFVISIGEKKGDAFDLLRERLRAGTGKIRKMGPDFLLYSILDAIVDGYFLVLERYGEEIEQTEEKLVASPDRKTLSDIYRLKRDMMFIHKIVWPLREVVGIFERLNHTNSPESVSVYFRDVYDHIIQVMENTEIYRDMLSSMLDIYLSSVSNRMNEVMKVLTIISTIFIPLTFIAGVYGMNFSNMPELRWHWGYFAAMGLMAAVALCMIFFFKRRKWF